MVSLLLIVVGAALFVRAYLGMVEVRDSDNLPFVSGETEYFGLTNQYLRFKRLSYLGLGVVSAGVIVGLSAAIHAHKIARRNVSRIP